MEEKKELDKATKEALKTIKIVDPTEALWTRLKDRTKEEMKSFEDSLLISKEVLLLCERKIKECQRKPHGSNSR